MVNYKKKIPRYHVYVYKKVQNWNEGNFPLAAVDFELVPQTNKVKRKYLIFINSL